MISQLELDEWKARRRPAPYNGTMICTIPCFRTRGASEKFYVDVYKHQGEFSVSFEGVAQSRRYLIANVPLPRSRKEISNLIENKPSMAWANGHKLYREIVTELIWRSIQELIK